MTERILDFSEQPANLSVRNDLLVIRIVAQDSLSSPAAPQQEVRPQSQNGGPAVREQIVPLEDIAVLVAAHPQVTFTLAVAAGLARHGGLLLTCDEKRQPAAMMLPLVTHHLQVERYAAQAQLKAPTRKRLWKQIVRAKIAAQARLLEERAGKDFGLRAMAGRVRSGDSGNLEAHAARVYWPALLGESFRRSPEGDDVNPFLNYGYAVLRATVARAICAAGLHPTFGLHHSNRYDTFCLADDLMEPFRPLVDRIVARLAVGYQRVPVLDREAKRALLEPLTGRFSDGGETRTLFDWAARTAFSLASVIDGSAARLEIPELRHA